jgi:PHD/YefM family antitoxin component YafN of YafNO toxin-antitoxin module
MRTLNYSNARQQFARAMNMVVEDRAPLLITRAKVRIVY